MEHLAHLGPAADTRGRHFQVAIYGMPSLHDITGLVGAGDSRNGIGTRLWEGLCADRVGTFQRSEDPSGSNRYPLMGNVSGTILSLGTNLWESVCRSQVAIYGKVSRFNEHVVKLDLQFHWLFLVKGPHFSRPGSVLSSERGGAEPTNVRRHPVRLAEGYRLWDCAPSHRR